MFKAILISIGFIICGAILQPVQTQAITLNRQDFTLVCPNDSLAYSLTYKIDQYVKEITDKWLDGPIPSGMRHTTIHVYVRPHNRAYCTRSANPQIYIYTNREHLDETLKHELTHALLMIRYPDLPSWTHEGIASRADAVGHQKMYLKILAWSRRSGTYPRLVEIMKGSIDSSNSTSYAASNSLVKFLLTKGNRYDLFLYSTGKCTLERAYGYKSVYHLQRAWVKWVNRPVEASKP